MTIAFVRRLTQIDADGKKTVAILHSTQICVHLRIIIPRISAKNRGHAFARPLTHDFLRIGGSYETLTSIFFGCASGSFVIVTCSTPLVSSAVIVFGSTVSGNEKLRETLP